jgi:hypothetical protein
MANALYDSARGSFLKGELDWLNNTFKVVLIDTANYSVTLAGHTNFGDVSGSAIVGTAVTLTNTTVQTNGAADADDVTFTTVSGASIEALVIYKDDLSGIPANFPLIAYIDTATGLPITPNGGDIIVTWDNGTNRIFRL